MICKILHIRKSMGRLRCWLTAQKGTEREGSSDLQRGPQQPAGSESASCPPLARAPCLTLGVRSTGEPTQDTYNQMEGHACVWPGLSQAVVSESTQPELTRHSASGFRRNPAKDYTDPFSVLHLMSGQHFRTSFCNKKSSVCCEPTHGPLQPRQAGNGVPTFHTFIRFSSSVNASSLSPPQVSTGVGTGLTGSMN